MGITYARGSITGRTETREYDFLVDTGATWLSIPQADIDALLLDTIPGGRANILTANGIAQTPMYRAIGILEGKEFTAEVVATSILAPGWV